MSETGLSPTGLLLTRKQAAEYLRRQHCQISYKTLTNYAANKNEGGGPPFFKDGDRALYSPAELDTWRRNRLIRVD